MIYTFLLSTLLIHNISHVLSAKDEMAPLIVGGSEATKGRYPYQVAMVSSGFQYCGASLVDKYWVLSAAHCKGVGDHVYIGRHNLDDSSEDYEDIEIEWETKHPDYDGYTLDNDYMMVKLKSPSSYDPVVLDDGSLDLSSGDAVTVMGWGTTSSGGPSSSVLLEVEVDVVSNSDCDMSYGFGQITDNMFCAARSGKDSCQGDSGGPIISQGANTAEDVQVGVVSWGRGCACDNYPGVYARISEKIDWINDQIANGTAPKNDNDYFVQHKSGRSYGPQPNLALGKLLGILPKLGGHRNLKEKKRLDARARSISGGLRGDRQKKMERK